MLWVNFENILLSVDVLVHTSFRNKLQNWIYNIFKKISFLILSIYSQVTDKWMDTVNQYSSLFDAKEMWLLKSYFFSQSKWCYIKFWLHICINMNNFNFMIRHSATLYIPLLQFCEHIKSLIPKVVNILIKLVLCLFSM